MSTIVTVNPPDVITVTAVTENEFNVTVTEPAPIAVTVSTQTGLPGSIGPAGPGVPPGGTTGQRLVKVNNTDYYTQWVDQTTTMANKEIAFAKNGLFTGDPDFVYDDDLHAVAVGQPIFLPDNPLGVSGDVDSYLQINLQNRNGGTSASADVIITADTGDDTEGYADFGICNSNYAVEAWDVTEALDGYLWSDGGNVAIGTLTPGKEIKFFIANTIHEAHPTDVIAKINSVGLDMTAGKKVSENGFNLTDLIVECASAIEEAAAFAAGSKIVIRTDLI